MASNARWAGWSLNRAAAVSLLALALAGCVPVSVTPGAQVAQRANAPAAVFAAPLALPATPTPAPTSTPYLALTQLAVDGTAVALAGIAEQATHTYSLDRIAEGATAQALQAAAAQDAAQNAQTATAGALAAQGAQVRATAEANDIRAKATQVSAFAQTALPAAATRVWWEAQTAQRQAETAGRYNTILTIVQLLGLVVVVLALGAGLFALWRAWQAETLKHAEKRAMIGRITAETAARWQTPPAAPPSPPEPSEADKQTAEAARQQAWRAAVLQTALYAHEAGEDWTYETLGPVGWGVVSRPAWDAVTAYLGECGYIVKRPRTPTRWADGTSYDQFRDAVRVAFPRPFPAGPAPAVYAPRTGAQAAQSAQAA